jgi:hypothetical protein
VPKKIDEIDIDSEKIDEIDINSEKLDEIDIDSGKIDGIDIDSEKLTGSTYDVFLSAGLDDPGRDDLEPQLRPDLRVADVDHLLESI